MCGPYWSQWDRDYEDDYYVKVDKEEDDECDVGELEPHDCGCCMYCLWMTDKDFM